MSEEQRLIDADNRIAEIKKMYCDDCDNYGGVKCRACWVDDTMCLIDDAPTVDAVEVVRCLDCRFYTHVDNRIGKCVFLIGEHQYVVQNGYCYLGERKDGARIG